MQWRVFVLKKGGELISMGAVYRRLFPRQPDGILHHGLRPIPN